MEESKSPTVTMTFSMPEHKDEFLDAFHGIDYKIALDDMDNYLRNKLKYEEPPKQVYEALQAARDYLCELTRDLPE